MKMKGFALFEITLFLGLIGLLLGSVFMVYFNVFQSANRLTIYPKLQQFAKQRMELILGRKRAMGYSTLTDPCVPGPGPSGCSTPTTEGYTVTATALPLAGNEGTLTVTASKTGGYSYTLTSIISSY